TVLAVELAELAVPPPEAAPHSRDGAVRWPGSGQRRRDHAFGRNGAVQPGPGSGPGSGPGPGLGRTDSPAVLAGVRQARGRVCGAFAAAHAGDAGAQVPGAA